MANIKLKFTNIESLYKSNSPAVSSTDCLILLIYFCIIEALNASSAIEIFRST